MDRWFFEDRDDPEDVGTPLRPVASSASISGASIGRKPSSSLNSRGGMGIGLVPTQSLTTIRKWSSEEKGEPEKPLDPLIQAALRDTELGWPDVYDDPLEVRAHANLTGLACGFSQKGDGLKFSRLISFRFIFM